MRTHLEPIPLKRRAQRQGTSLGINWPHEYAISDWEADRTYDPKRGASRGTHRVNHARYVRANVYRELLRGKRDCNGAQKRTGVMVPLPDNLLAPEPERPDQRRQLIERVVEEARLTRRERDGLPFVLQGNGSQAIAEQLGIGQAYASTMRASIMRKLHRALAARKLLPKGNRPYTSREFL